MAFAAVKALDGQDAHFFDYDNDGFLDLLLIGNSAETKTGSVRQYGRDSYSSDYDNDGFLDLDRNG